jgi:hypothetical protein
VTGSRDELTRPAGKQRGIRLGLTKTCRTEKYFCPTFFCQQRAWRAARIQLTVRGRRLVHSMLRSPWHNIHAQRGRELGNDTADEHSGTLIRASTDRTSRSRRAAANPSLIGDQLVEFPPATGLADLSHQCLSVLISVDQRSFAVPHRSQPLPESPPSPTFGREFEKALSYSYSYSASRYSYSMGSSQAFEYEYE